MKIFFSLFFFFLPSIISAQIITTIAGGGTGTDGMLATAASIYDPCYIAFDAQGNLYFSETLGNRVRKIDGLTNIITTVAGNGVPGYSGDNGPSTAAKINQPCGIAIDTIGNIFFADEVNNRIRKIDKVTGIISTVIGNSIGSFSGDGGAASSATLFDPCGITFDKFGNLYIADGSNSRVRKVSATGIINTVAGNGIAGNTGDGGLATSASCDPFNICVDSSGNLYIAEYGGLLIRKVNSAGIISTIAGNPLAYTYNGDDIPATAANLTPNCLAIGSNNLLYISDVNNNRIRNIDIHDTIHTIVGNGIAGSTGDGALAISAEINEPSGIAFDQCGNLYICQVTNPRIRKVLFYPTCDETAISLLFPEVSIIDNKISIYPNPACSSITISSTQKIKQIIITNFMGEAVYAGVYDIEKADVNIAGLPEGVYVVRVTDDEGSVTMSKIVKQ